MYYLKSKTTEQFVVGIGNIYANLLLSDSSCLVVATKQAAQSLLDNYTCEEALEIIEGFPSFNL